MLAGRSINGNSRPSGNLADYLEFGNNTGNFERQSISRPVSTVYADTGSVNAYSINATSAPVGQPLQFMAITANTGSSTLTTAATGAKALRNTDGSNLTAAEIQANAVVEVAYDGAQFVLFKRPFNDRVVVIDSN